MTDVRIIGLCLLVMNATGFVAIMPDFDGGTGLPGKNLPPHLAVIAAPTTDVYYPGAGWKTTGTFEFEGEQWTYVVVDGESVRFDNVARRPLPTIPANVPKLSGLCKRCTGISPKYLTAGTGRSTHVYFTSGYAEAVKDAHGRIDTVVHMRVPFGLLKVNAGGSKIMKIIPGGRMMIANYPEQELLAGFPSVYASHENHFLAYYKMASTFMGRRCKGMPQMGHGGINLTDLDVVILTIGSRCSNSQYP